MRFSRPSIRLPNRTSACESALSAGRFGRINGIRATRGDKLGCLYGGASNKRTYTMNTDLQDDDMTKELLNNFEWVVQEMNKFGHAVLCAVPKNNPEFNEEIVNWQEIWERDKVQDLAESLSAESGIEITGIRSNRDDPPDCFAIRTGEGIGIEVTILIKSKILRRIAQARPDRRNRKSYPSWEKFLDEQWTHEEFIKEVQNLIIKKDDKAKNKVIIDVLLIYTDEGDLSPERLKDWLSNQKFFATNIKEVFLLRSYWPGYKEHAPLFKPNIERSEISDE